MKTNYIILLLIMTSLLLSSCNDISMDKSPITEVSEDNVFTTYDNFASFMYPCYGLFFNAEIRTNFYDSGQSSMEVGDFWGGYLTRKDGESPFRTQNVTTEGQGLWDFTQIRRINMMLSHLNDGNLTKSEADHWKSVGYFFYSWYYMHLMDNFGDVPWVDKVLGENDPEAYGERVNRYQVADSLLARLQWAESHIGNFSSKDGSNMIDKHCVQAVLSRFTLREATWRKYHQAGVEYENYLQECVRVSKELMDDYPTLYKGSGIDAATSLASGYGELWTTEDLSSIPGIILYQEYSVAANKMHTASQYQHANYGNADVPQHIIEMFLMKNGKPIANPTSGFEGGEGKDMFDEFRNRDQRLYQNVMPPYRVTTTKSEFTSGSSGYANNTKWDFYPGKYSARNREYIDLMGINSDAVNGGVGMKRLPAQNWSASILAGCPNTQNSSQAQYIRSGSGYYEWKHYTHWQFNTNTSSNTQDKPIFKIEEVLLNYAEAKYELGSFDQIACDISINRLRDRVGVAHMTVSEINDSWDPKRDKGGNSWWSGNFEDYVVEPVLWEIRRERMIELFCEGFAWYDVRRWAKAPYFINRQPYGMYVHKDNREGYVKSYTGSYIDISTGNSVSMSEREGGYIFTYGKAVGWLDKYYLLPIPPSEIVINPKLKQNSGY